MTPEEQAEADRKAWDERAYKLQVERAVGVLDLYSIYSKWTGQLHHWVARELGKHIDVEYFPQDYLFKLYSGRAQDRETTLFSTVPGLTRPSGEASAQVRVPKHNDNPTQAELDEAFRQLCLAAARVLGIDLDKPKLPEKKHALKKAPKRRRKK
jgi:hypothetical protein